MPILRIIIVAGTVSATQKAALFSDVSNAIHRTLDAPLSNIRIALHEVAQDNLSHAGQTPVFGGGSEPMFPATRP